MDYPAEYSFDRHPAKTKIEKDLKIIARQTFYSRERFAQNRIEATSFPESLGVGG